MARQIVTRVRKCGRRKEGKVYLVGGDERSENGVLNALTLLHPPIPYDVPLHRIARIVHADPILRRQPMELWWAGSSEETEIKKGSAQWSAAVFGMPIPTRLSIGECQGLTTDVAIKTLMSSLRWDTRIIDTFRELTLSGITNDQRALPEYESLHAALSDFVKHRKVNSLIGIQAAIWRIESVIKPKQKHIYAPILVRFMFLLGLPKDAVVIQTRARRAQTG